MEGETSAQLMVVIGTNHENYEENLSLGLKLHALLEQRSPGIMRPLQLRGQRFNQDLNPGSARKMRLRPHPPSTNGYQGQSPTPLRFRTQEISHALGCGSYGYD